MISEFRKKKIVHLFKLYDNDNSNFIEKKDFEVCAKFIAEKRGWQPGDANYKNTVDGVLKIWDSIQKYADKDNDGKVSLDEWVSMCDDYAKNAAVLEWQNLYCKFMFEMNDVTGDGVIDVDEFATVLECFEVDKSVAVASFQKLAKGKSTISLDEFQQLWKEFFASDDPNAPGNFVFGVTDF